jgi:hypothetical protein
VGTVPTRYSYIPLRYRDSQIILTGRKSPADTPGICTSNKVNILTGLVNSARTYSGKKKDYHVLVYKLYPCWKHPRLKHGSSTYMYVTIYIEQGRFTCMDINITGYMLLTKNIKH